MKISKICFGIVLLLLASIFSFQALSYGYYTRLGPAPGFFPLWINGLLIISSLLFILESIKEDAPPLAEILPRGKGLQSILATLGGLILFCLLVPPLGFVIPCAVMLGGMLVGHYKWQYAMAAASLCSVTILFVFQSVLGIVLPVNEFGW